MEDLYICRRLHGDEDPIRRKFKNLRNLLVTQLKVTARWEFEVHVLGNGLAVN